MILIKFVCIRETKDQLKRLTKNYKKLLKFHSISTESYFLWETTT